MNIIRLYNQNRRTIWIAIIAIIFIIIAIHVLNDLVKKKNVEDNNTIINTITEKDYKNNLDISITLSDEDVKEEKELVIDQFIRYCNAGKINEAYNLLTDKCKEYVYPNIETFKKNYIDIVFNSKKLYSKERYIGSTYKVKLYEDMLSTGSISNSTIEDFYTIEKENTKINISGYIKEEQINKSASSNNIEVNVLSKKIFKEYEEYTLEVKNNTDKDILLDSMENTRTIYLEGNGNVKYYPLIHEKSINDLTIPKSVTKVVTLKFTKEYNSKSVVNALAFSNIIMDSKEYGLNSGNYTNRKGIIVKFK